jgi:hypothetical protein
VAPENKGRLCQTEINPDPLPIIGVRGRIYLERVAGQADVMNDQPKRRPLFQFHLSTAIVLMFVAGMLLWANMYVVVINPSWFDSGLPLMDHKFEDDDFPLHTPFTLPINIALNLAFLVGVAAICERLMHRKTDCAGERKSIWEKLRLHRLTIAVMAFVFGGILVLNRFIFSFEYESLSGHYGSAFYGWPYPTGFYSSFYCAKSGIGQSPDAKGFELSGFSWHPYLYSPLVVDLVVWLFILCMVGAFCEWLIHRKERQHE